LPARDGSRLTSLRFFTAVFLSALLAACAETPTQPAATGAHKAASDRGLGTASSLYEGREYGKALQQFDRVIAAPAAGANSKRLAYLGKALIYLGKDEKWHNLDKAKLAISDAAKIKPADGEQFTAEANMVRDAVMALAGSQSAYDALRTKTGGAGGEIAQLKKQRDALLAERDALLEEQASLNQALEKLKELTLKN
ncbi:MAG: hypothetical protein PVF89_01740, partial [Lysobacterales bacterium]